MSGAAYHAAVECTALLHQAGKRSDFSQAQGAKSLAGAQLNVITGEQINLGKFLRNLPVCHSIPMPPA